MTARILIADNDEIARARLTELIQSHDHWDVCAQAEDGQKALLKARNLKPDIIILESAMPVMDGLSTAQEIGKVLPATPIVLMNTFPTLPSLELEAKKAGIRKVVSKPGTCALFGVIEQLLQIGPQVAAEGKL
jgi:DNA-binding NarL/FixJ family response regulator